LDIADGLTLPRLCTTTIRCGKIFIASQRILNFCGCALVYPPLNQQRGGFGMFAVVVGYAEKLKRNSVRMARVALNPKMERRAKFLLNQALIGEDPAIRIPEDSGWTRLAVGQLDGLEAAVRQVSAFAREWAADASRSPIRKSYLFNMMRPQEVLDHPAFLSIALDGGILAAVARYLGQAPCLQKFSIMRSPPNSSTDGSQLYHYDHRDSRQAKLFLNLCDVTDAAGPTHFLSAADSKRIDAKVGYRQDRYTDDQIYSAVPQSRVINTVGPAGTGFLIDTARCLHYGSRGNSTDRLVLLASYVRTNNVNRSDGCEVLDPIRKQLAAERYADDPLRSFALTASC